MKHRPYLSQTHALLDTTDWSGTPLGPLASWPLSLRGYVAMVMAMPTPAIIFWGPQLTQIYNDGYAQIMGPRHPRFFGAPYRDCWPDTYPLIYPWMRRVLDHAEVVEVERERIPVTRFGFEEDAYFTFTFTPLRDDQGQVAGILQPVYEVTENVLAERRAKLLRNLSSLLPAHTTPWAEAEKLLDAAQEDIVEALIGQLDASGELCVVASVRAQSLQAQGQAELAAAVREVMASALPRWIASPRAIVLPLIADATQPPRAVMVTKTNPRLHENGAYVEFLEMVAVELSSALQRAEATTAQERQRASLHRLFQQAPAGIAVLRGPQHVFELVNPKYQALIGDRDVIGRPLGEALPDLAQQRFLDILDRVYRTGKPHIGLAEPGLVMREAGGSSEQAYFNYVYQPLHDEQERPEGILVFCYEVTEQVLARQRSDRLADALRQEHQRKDEFLAMLAHELRNPLAPVRSAAELLMRAPSDVRVVSRASEIIARQVRHMSALVNDLLEVSRVTRGLETLQREPQDLRSVLLDASEQVRPLIEAHSHRLLLDLPARSPFVLGDHKRLVQIVTNLLNNAAKYTPDGGQIALRLEASQGMATISVADNGIGIDPELLPRVFDLFVQGQRGAARAEGGLGIGLALVRSLVEMHGGSVAAVSAGEGRGSCFSVKLPTHATSSERDPAVAEPPTPARGEGQPVLVVDDNVDAAQMLALQLQDAGYQVDVVHSGHDAIAACASQRYLACLVDIGLPDLHGTEVAARLKAEPDNEVPLLVAVSGYGQESDLRVAREAGFDHYFVKPVDIVPLSHLLRT